ncbi:hypothetical protein Tco_1472673 [Tanacetum coccineum]
MGMWRCGGDDGDEGGGDDVDGSVMATVVASRVMAWWCTTGVMAAVDGDDVVGEVVMERSGGCWPEVTGNSPKNMTAPET